MQGTTRATLEHLQELPKGQTSTAYQKLASLAEAKLLVPRLVAAAQGEYDKWDETDVDTYAGGGICHLIADEMQRILDSANFDASTVSSSHEQHVYVAVKLAEGVYVLDIPHGLYERGAAFTWYKIPDVKFHETFVIWHQVSPDPEAYESYIF